MPNVPNAPFHLDEMAIAHTHPELILDAPGDETWIRMGQDHPFITVFPGAVSPVAGGATGTHLVQAPSYAVVEIICSVMASPAGRGLELAGIWDCQPGPSTESHRIWSASSCLQVRS
jgi:hypothetical protein